MRMMMLTEKQSQVVERGAEGMEKKERLDGQRETNKQEWHQGPHSRALLSMKKGDKPWSQGKQALPIPRVVTHLAQAREELWVVALNWTMTWNGCSKAKGVRSHAPDTRLWRALHWSMRCLLTQQYGGQTQALAHPGLLWGLQRRTSTGCRDSPLHATRRWAAAHCLLGHLTLMIPCHTALANGRDVQHWVWSNSLVSPPTLHSWTAGVWWQIAEGPPLRAPSAHPGRDSARLPRPSPARQPRSLSEVLLHRFWA